MPGAAAKLREMPERKYLMRTSPIDVAAVQPGMSEIIRDDASGLGVWLVRAGAGEEVVGPAPSQGAGQFGYDLQSEVEHEGKTLGIHGVIFASPSDAPVRIRCKARLRC